MSTSEEGSPLLEPETALTLENHRKYACWCIYLAQLFERFAWCCVFGNIGHLLRTTPLQWSTPEVITIHFITMGIFYFTSLFIGSISNSSQSRRTAILVGYAMVIISCGIMTKIGSYIDEYQRAKHDDPSSMPKPPYWCWKKDHCTRTIYIVLSIAAAGSGIIFTNSILFGCDQVARPSGVPQFLHRIGLWINIGYVIAFVTIIPMLQYGMPVMVGYLLPLSFLGLSFCIFMLGIKYYEKGVCGRMPAILSIYRIYKHARARRRQYSGLRQPSLLLDYAINLNGGNYKHAQIENVKTFWKVSLGICLLLPYWICLGQTVGGVFLQQGEHLRLDLFEIDEPDTTICPKIHHNVTPSPSGIIHAPISAAVFSGFSSLAAALLLLFLQSVYSTLSRCGVWVTVYKRMVVGMILMAVSLLTAGIIETLRLYNIKECGSLSQQSFDGSITEVCPGYTIFAQIAQYWLVGTSQVFVMITGLEYVYIQSPAEYHGLTMGLYWAVGGIGYLLGMCFQSLYFSHADYFLYALAVFQLISLSIYIILGRNLDLRFDSVQPRDA